MEDTNRVYRIRTGVGKDAPNVIHVPLKQSYDMFEILSLKLDQKNTYKTYDSDYGVIVGRVIANGGFGVPNAKVSVFIKASEEDSYNNNSLYKFSSATDTDDDGVRYNLLPDYVDDGCHQDVGTFPNKRLVLDNNDIIEVFDEYWKYTTTTNHSGDYMLFGIPQGSQQIHVDVDLSDCGILSQRPRDMIEKGYNATMFDSPNKFKYSTNLNSLAQIISQDRGVYVYPYWGDVSDTDDKFSITRCDINLDYKFESYAVFMGSIMTDSGSNAIGKNCTPTQNNGRMRDLVAGEGMIEMIRKTPDNKVEEYPIMGNRLIDGDGVWCYQIPMNLDYVTTDEFGNLVPTDNPDKGIATRARVRFRVSVDETPNDATARKRARYLIPNNPRITDEEFNETKTVDYEFGSSTREESYCDMFWNKVYTVKNYIPKLQKNTSETNRKHSGIKLIKDYGQNNPMPYNSLNIKLGFTYRLICIITKIIINLIEFVNEIISVIGAILCLVITILQLPVKVCEDPKLCLSVLGVKICPFKLIILPWKIATMPIVELLNLIMPPCIGLNSEFCDDGINKVTYYPGCGYFLFRLFDLNNKGLDCVWEKTKDIHGEKESKECSEQKLSKEDCAAIQTEPLRGTAMLYNCVENQLAQDNNVTSFDFQNDWVNGVLYAPLWHRKITPKKRFFFGLFSRKAKDDWCSSDRSFGGLRVIQHCVLKRSDDGKIRNFDNESVDFKRLKDYNFCGNSCHKENSWKTISTGVINTKKTMLDESVYYYVPVEYDKKLEDVKLLFATDIVLLGSLNACDMNGIPQFFKTLESSTYNMPTDILFTDYEFIMKVNDRTGESERMEYYVDGLIKTSEMAGCDWGNPNEFGKSDGGLFYSIGCSTIELRTKSCVNLSRVCEYGVSLDETKEVADLGQIKNDEPTEEVCEVDNRYFQKLVTDGFISWDELYNLDERSMFATMNGNRLKTRLNTKNGLKEYDFRYLYPENFDGSLQEVMQNTTKRYSPEVNYKNNYNLEQGSRDYYIFRMGNNPFYYDSNSSFPRYENSFYFYFGLIPGKTAIDKFNSKYFAECNNADDVENKISIESRANSWCSTDDNLDGYIAFDFSNLSTPYDLLINGVSNNTTIEMNGITDEKIIFGEEEIEGYERKGGMIQNGSYQGVITDGDGEITEFNFTIRTPYLTFSNSVYNFKQPNNVLFEKYGNYQDIAADHKDVALSEGKVIRPIGGVITISDIYDIEEFRIDIIPNKPIEGYDGISVSNTDVKHDSFIYKDDSLRPAVYGFGVPKGNTEYTVTVTQLCNDVDTPNSVTSVVYVSEPKSYKMYINDIDYEIIKNFNNNVGWDINGTVANPNPTEATVTIQNNPWFSVDKIFNNDIYNNVEEFNVEYNDEDNSFEIYDEKGNGPYVIQNLVEEFTKNHNNVKYNWVDEYIVSGYENINWNSQSIEDKNLAYENIGDFINDVNKVMYNRRELLEKMKDTFFMYCEDSVNNIYISSSTEDKPYTQTVVYHKEKAVEFEDYNVLDYYGEENTDRIEDIRIPTITYGGSKFSETGTIDAPCLAEVNGVKKKPYSVGIMNNAGYSIPEGITPESDEDRKYISAGTSLNKLFSFPIIDKTLTINFIAWSAFTDIPVFWRDDKETINMNGILAGEVFNGNTVDNMFDTQTFGGIKLKLSEDINKDNYNTYVEKRVIDGFDLVNLGEIANFTQYITNANYAGSIQYAFVQPSLMPLFILDKRGCGVSQAINGAEKIVLSDETVNDCKNNNKKIVINASDDTYYYIYEADTNGKKYPLYDAKKNNGVWQITQRIDKEYNVTNDKPYYLLSYQTKDLKNGVDTDFNSKESIEKEDGSIEERDTSGYGTNGIFTTNNTNTYPLFIISEKDNVRTLSPIYDFSTVNGRVRIDSVEEEGVIKYRFGVSVKSGGKYIDNYSYKISGNYNNTEVVGETEVPNGGRNYVYGEITQDLYYTLISPLMSKNTIASNTTIKIIDKTGVTHIARVNGNDVDK